MFSLCSGDDPLLGDKQQYNYMTVDDMKSLGDDSMRLDVTSDEKSEYNRNSMGKSYFRRYRNKLNNNLYRNFSPITCQ